MEFFRAHGGLAFFGALRNCRNVFLSYVFFFLVLGEEEIDGKAEKWVLLYFYGCVVFLEEMLLPNNLYHYELINNY